MPQDTRIAVKAIMDGHFGVYRKEGDKFFIDEEQQFSRRWMKKISAKDIKVAEPEE